MKLLFVLADRSLYLLELLLAGAQRHELVRALHPDRGVLRGGAVGNPLQQKQRRQSFNISQSQSDTFFRPSHFAPFLL